MLPNCTRCTCTADGAHYNDSTPANTSHEHKVIQMHKMDLGTINVRLHVPYYDICNIGKFRHYPEILLYSMCRSPSIQPVWDGFPQNSSGKTPSSEPCVPPTSTDAVAAPNVPDPQPQHSSSKVILSPKAATIQHASNLVCAIHAVLDDGSSQNDGVAYGQAISKFFPKLPFTNDTSWYHAELVPQAHPHPDVDSINMLKLWINNIEYHTPTRYQLFLLAEPAFVLHYVFLSFFHVSYRGY